MGFEVCFSEEGGWPKAYGDTSYGFDLLALLDLLPLPPLVLPLLLVWLFSDRYVLGLEL